MKKYVLLSIAVLLGTALLAGCVKVQEKLSFSEVQKIVVYDAGGNEKTVLTEQADINAFMDAVGADGWRFSQLPEGVTQTGAFAFWQEETVIALFGERESKVNEIDTIFRIYGGDGGDYLVIETGLMDVSFSISRAAADYLRELVA